ncbi:hypothetical protein HanRHA438_Chr16g0767651 [Helianthus annuus]|nr:hypothetical protein HanRHA438_Chr16g0767651 [Helianthus annuus]
MYRKTYKLPVSTKPGSSSLLLLLVCQAAPISKLTIFRILEHLHIQTLSNTTQ